MTDAVDWVVDSVFEVDNKLERMEGVDEFNFDVRDKVDFEETGRDFKPEDKALSARVPAQFLTVGWQEVMVTRVVISTVIILWPEIPEGPRKVNSNAAWKKRDHMVFLLIWKQYEMRINGIELRVGRLCR